MSPPGSIFDGLPQWHAELMAHPHDAYFKRVFSDPALAAALFRSHLPPALAEALDFAGLEVLPGSFVKRSLQQSHSDLLFSVPERAGGEKVLVYLIFEHQTTVDSGMPLRLLSYMTELWQSLPRPRQGPLPPVIPVVLHQGPEPWTVPEEFADSVRPLLAGDPAAKPEATGQGRDFIPKFRYLLLDLTKMQPAAEEPDHSLRAVLHLMKLARQQQRMRDFLIWLKQQHQPLSDALERLSLLYALHQGQVLDLVEINSILEGNQPLKETTMSTAQYLMDQGFAKGREEGLEEGREQGREEGVLIGQLRLLQKLMGQLITSDAELNLLQLKELKQRYEVLEREYEEKFKTR